MFVIVGLGNPGEEYEMTRHNVGRMVLDAFVKKIGLPDFVESSKYVSLVSEGSLGKEKVLLMEPATYMNKSGSAVKKAVTSAKKAEKLVVIYDDIDLPLGKIKISHGRGSGGHKGAESIIKALKTKDFVRVRIGVSAATPSGKIKKPKGGQKVLDFLLGNFKKSEEKLLKKMIKTAGEIVETIVTEGAGTAMNRFN